MYHPTTRLLTLLELLQTRPLWSGTDLSARLEVEPRSVRRYIVMLQDMGMPVETVRGPGGGYRLRPGFKLPPLLFTEDEAAAIVVGLLNSSANFKVAAASAEGALAKVLRVLPVRARERLDAVASNTVMSMPDAGGPLDVSVLLALSDAVQQRQCVSMTYAAENQSESQRVVEPYGLAGWWGQWYLVAHCRLRGGLRIFRLDRMREVRVTAETFARPADFDMQAHVVEHLARSNSRYRIQIEFQAAMTEVRKKIPDGYGTLTEIPDGVRYETRHGHLETVSKLLIETGLPFTVSGPPELKDCLASIAKRILRAAGRVVNAQ